MTGREKRLQELSGKSFLTVEEMEAYQRLSDPGTFVGLPPLEVLGIPKEDRAAPNLREINARTEHAMNQGCYIEVISLRLQLIELWLRMFWVAKNARGDSIDPEDRKTFGMVVSECAQLGFPSPLVDKLRSFNSGRIDAVHKYLLGTTAYSNLRRVCEESQGLDQDILTYVARAIGRPLN